MLIGSQLPPALKHHTWSGDPRDPRKSPRRIASQTLNFGLFMTLIPYYRFILEKSLADLTGHITRSFEFAKPCPKALLVI